MPKERRKIAERISQSLARMQDVSLREIVLKLGIMLVVALVGLAGCSALNRKAGLKNDNLIESCAEDMLKSRTGLDIDLSPEDPDDDSYSLDMWKKD